MAFLTTISLWQTPHASTLMRTFPAPGSGISRSTNSQSPSALLICAACIFLFIVESHLTEVLRGFPQTLVADKGQKICVDLVLMSCGQAVRQSRVVDLFRVFNEFGRSL